MRTMKSALSLNIQLYDVIYCVSSCQTLIQVNWNLMNFLGSQDKLGKDRELIRLRLTLINANRSDSISKNSEYEDVWIMIVCMYACARYY